MRLLRRIAIVQCRRHASTSSTLARALRYEAYGDPQQVLSLVEMREKETILKQTLGDDEVIVHWQLAPVNPADINMIQGIYPIKPSLPATGGNEGVGVVHAVGKAVKSLQVGTRVIPSRAGIGTWQALQKVPQTLLRAVREDMSLDAAAQLLVNPPTAYRMLSDFNTMPSDALVVQNGATSAVGRNVIQLAKRKFKLRTLNIIRDRNSAKENNATIEELKQLGATAVVTDRDFNKNHKKIVAENGPAHLALNCVGGQLTARMASMLTPGGVMVTYGGMSMQTVQVPTAPLIFRDIALRGFWMSEWYTKSRNAEEAQRVIDELSAMIVDGTLTMTPCEHVRMDNWRHALDLTMNVRGAKKQLLVME